MEQNVFNLIRSEFSARGEKLCCLADEFKLRIYIVSSTQTLSNNGGQKKVYKVFATCNNHNKELEYRFVIIKSIGVDNIECLKYSLIEIKDRPLPTIPRKKRFM